MAKEKTKERKKRSKRKERKVKRKQAGGLNINPCCNTACARANVRERRLPCTCTYAEAGEAVDRRGTALGDFSWRCLDLAVMSSVHKP